MIKDNEMDIKDYEQFFGENCQRFSNDFLRILEYIETGLIRDLPNTNITIEYLILSLLGNKTSLAYDAMNELASEMALSIIYDGYFQLINATSVSAIKPNRVLKFSEEFIKCVDLADKEREKLKEEKITSVHTLLALLNDAFENDKFRMALNKIGIDYGGIYEHCIIDTINHKISNGEKIPHKTNLPINVDFDLPGGGKTQIIALPIDPNMLISGEMEPTIKVVKAKANNGGEDETPEYCININKKVREGKIQEVVGRENEFKEIIRTLGRRKKNNVILVGGEGVGKTAICEGLAYLIENHEVPNNLFGKEILSLDMTALIAGTTLRGMFEERVRNLIDILIEKKKYILFIDNIDAVLNDKGKNEYDISSMLSSVLENGDVQIIGTSSYKGFRKTFDSNPSLSRKFQKMQIEAPTIEEALNILRAVAPSYESFHKVKYTEDAIEYCVNLADKYITDRNLPDSAIDLLDEAGSDLNAQDTRNYEIITIRNEINETRGKILEAKKKDNFELVDELTAKNKELVSKMIETTNKIEEERTKNPPVVNFERILDIVAEKTGIPISKLTTDDKKKLANMEERIGSEVIGQDEAVETVCRALKRNRVGLKSGRTMGAFMLIGQTGTGKTLLAKKLAKEMFGSEKALVRFDMSEYTDKTSVNKLIGANPGYVGYEEGGLMTESIKNKKHCVLLLDEIEKADQEVYNMFLQVFDEGFLTDNTGQKIDFKNVIIILTSNAGAKSANEFGKGIGFEEDPEENKKRILIKELKKKFPPEFLNRLDSVVYFNSLNDDNLRKIIKIEMDKLKDKIIKMGSMLYYGDDTINYILEKTKEEKEFGARPILRAIQDEFEDRITDIIIEKDDNSFHSFTISIENNKVKIS